MQHFTLIINQQNCEVLSLLTLLKQELDCPMGTALVQIPKYSVNMDWCYQSKLIHKGFVRSLNVLNV